jgi:hypothetical protein
MPAKEDTMSNQYKVVAINGSPHEAVGNTSQMIGMIASALSGQAAFMAGKYKAEGSVALLLKLKHLFG